ncbi:MAG: DNA primase small subunit domain-containing protein [archaeon]
MFDLQNSPEAIFLQKHFATYYANHFVDSVPFPELREFGFGVFKRKIANRNLSFASVNELNYFLKEKVPMFFSYSTACYKFPSRTPTPEKKLIKADLIYEFDADELALGVPEINGIQWFAAEHLEEAKRQVFRLLDFIENDFNFPSSGISINFSGKAGFHVHFRSEIIESLNNRARIELVDYLTGNSVDFVNLGFDFVSLTCPTHSGLWAKRLISGAKKLLGSDVKVISKITGVQAKKVSQVLSDKERLFSSLDNGRLMPLGRRSSDFWSAIFDTVLEKESVPIDRQTSVDLSKIVRVPQTLHGDTGFLAKKISIDSLKSFDPFKDAVVVGSDVVRVHVKKAPKFSINSESFGPFEEQDVEIPLFAAIFLIGKGAAVLK